MDQTQLEECIRLHELWLDGSSGGVRADLSGANLSGASLWRTNLQHADLSRASLSGANLQHTDLSEANLQHTDLSRASLRYANLQHTDLSGANLSGADLKGTILEGKAVLSFQFERHAACFYGTDEIRIGCHTKTVADWLTQYKEVGQSEGYSGKQIEMYGNFIKQCAVILATNVG